jgi:Coenzyme F420-reducing hydrogenase, beta subunit
MKPDYEGFLYPNIDVSLCVECGLCKKVCTFQKSYDITNNYKEPLVYGVKHISDEIRSLSTSGGMFTALSDEVLSHNGAVYGAGYDEHMVVCHQRAIDENKRNSFRGSKYVQSEMRQTTRQIETDLAEGISVLFTGTPCQVAAVGEYLREKGVNTDGLLLCDIICYGTPSPLIFSEYLKLCGKRKGKPVTNHIFRTKIFGWHTHIEMNVFEDGQKDYESYYSKLFRFFFISRTVLRPACYNCKFTNFNRPSDITIGDFWGIEKTMPEFDDNKGISLVLINTKKGEMAFDVIKDKTINRKSNVKDCIQPNLVAPTKKHDLRDEFWSCYQKYGFEFVLNKYFGYGPENMKNKE